MQLDSVWLQVKQFSCWNLDLDELRGQMVDSLPQNMLIWVFIAT